MLQDTVQRVTDPTLFGRPIIVTNDQYRFLVAEQLAAIGTEADILLEPVRRDSGPAIAAGATFAAKRDENSLLVALAADHVISDAVAFVKVCRLAADAAGADRIVTFGVRPTRPATEYGYIRAGASIGADIFAVEKFVEKPDGKTADRYVKEGYLWNSGNFMFRTGEPRRYRGRRRTRRQRSRFHHPLRLVVCACRREGDRLCGDGAHPMRGSDAGVVRLV
jgi:mannose-1-phosphate guanylyltransferase/mannose-6-phosphate isomerase